MALVEDLTKIAYIVKKDIRTYYFKPPNISWGIIFPAALVIAFSIRNPTDIREMVPGLIGMAILFGTTSMCAIVLTFEKRIGSLERLILAPIPINGIVLGKILGGTIFGIINAGVMILFSLVFLDASISNLFIIIGISLIAAFEFSTLGILIASSVTEVFEAQTLSNYFRFPMIFLCGVFVPLTALPRIIQPISYILPLTYVIDALRSGLIGQISMFPTLINISISLGYSLCFFILAARILTKNSQKGN